MLKQLAAAGRFECGLDEVVAGKRWAFVAVAGAQHLAALAVAVLNEPGRHPVSELWAHATSLGLMQAPAEALNEVEGLDRRAAAQIVASPLTALRR